MMMRVAITCSIVLCATGAFAQVQSEPERAWLDFADQQQKLLENATTQDCAVACKALESLASAARHICDVSPDHCEEAKTRFRAAADRVHGSCPQCEVRASVNAPPDTPVQTMNAGAQSEAISERSSGGCGGCATASGTPDLLSALALLGLLKRKRSRV